MHLAADPDLKNVGLMARVQIGQFWCWAARLWLAQEWLGIAPSDSEMMKKTTNDTTTTTKTGHRR